MNQRPLRGRLSWRFLCKSHFCLRSKFFVPSINGYWSVRKVTMWEQIFTVNWWAISGLILVYIQSIWNEFCKNNFFFFFNFFKFNPYYLLHSCRNIMCGLWRNWNFLSWSEDLSCALHKFFYLFLEIFYLILDFSLKLSLLLFAFMSWNWFINVFTTSKYYLGFIQW